MTDLSTIQSWPREQLESAFSQREEQLADVEAQLEIRREYADEMQRQRTEALKEAANLKATLASSTSAGHAAFEAERKRAGELNQQLAKYVAESVTEAEQKAIRLDYKQQVESLQAELAAFHAAVQREMDYVNEQARVADANSKEWANYGGASDQAAYRAGMWYAYNDIRNRIPTPDHSMKRGEK